MYRFSSRKPKQELSSNLLHPFRELRDNKHIHRMIITNTERAQQNPSIYKEIVNIPASYDLFEDNIGMGIYGSFISFIDWDSNTGVTIENAKIARFEEKVFRLLFQFLRKSNKKDLP